MGGEGGNGSRVPTRLHAGLAQLCAAFFDRNKRRRGQTLCLQPAKANKPSKRTLNRASNVISKTDKARINSDTILMVSWHPIQPLRADNPMKSVTASLQHPRVPNPPSPSPSKAVSTACIFCSGDNALLILMFAWKRRCSRGVRVGINRSSCDGSNA